MTKLEIISALKEKGIDVSIFDYIDSKGRKTQKVKVTGKHWEEKEHILAISYSHEFSHEEILNDVAYKVLALSGYVVKEVLDYPWKGVLDVERYEY